jgi:WD40 repeat protein
MGIELNGLVPLSAIWHPQDQFLSLTGQNNSIVVVETTNARHVRGHHLHSVGGILAVEFSPDGRMAAVGNDSGVVAFYSLSGASFVTAYELVVTVENDRLSIKWSKNGLFVLIATRDSLLIVGRKRRDRYGKAVPSKCAGFSIRKVVKDLSGCHAVSIDLQSQYISVVGSKGTSILDVSRDFSVAREWLSGPCYATAWSPLGRWLATIGKDKVLTIYETGEERVDRWRPLFSVTCDYVGRALAWGPLIVGGLLYLAYAGEGNEITVMEIRTQEGTWETVMRIQRPGAINALDWHTDGLLAAALSNGTVSIVDLAYLQTGVAVNEMDYNWQRQALTSFTEIRRNRGTNMMRAVRWIPSAPGSDSLLAVGGSDGELEIVDLTERQRCRGYTQG